MRAGAGRRWSCACPPARLEPFLQDAVRNGPESIRGRSFEIMRILVWGFYSQGNFGDDAMALLVTRRLRDNGADPVVFGSAPHLEEHLKCAFVERLDRSEGVSGLIIGGGGLLTNPGRLKYLIHPGWIGEKRILRELRDWLRREGVPAVAVSIGGDGRRLLRLKADVFRELFLPGTVRLRSDLEVLAADRIEGYRQFPDILWCSDLILGEELPVRGTNGGGGPVRVAINLKKRNAEPSHIESLRETARGFGGDLVSLRSHVDVERYDYEYVHRNCEVADYTGDVAEFVRQLSEFDVVVSSKLHVGLTAMSLGIPFVSYQGPLKAKQALTEMGLSEFICDSKEALSDTLEGILGDLGSARAAIGRVRARERSLAGRHLECIDEFVGSLRD